MGVLVRVQPKSKLLVGALQRSLITSGIPKHLHDIVFTCQRKLDESHRVGEVSHCAYEMADARTAYLEKIGNSLGETEYD